MKQNNVICNAKIKLKDGSILNEKSPHVLRTLLHQQLKTRHNRFKAKPKGRRPVPVVRRGKAVRPEKPANFRKEMEKMDGLRVFSSTNN